MTVVDVSVIVKYSPGVRFVVEVMEVITLAVEAYAMKANTMI